MEQIYLVKYTGSFGFIKPWTAVRDSETFSQQFLTPSIVSGIERKLFPELLANDDGEIHKIVGHRLSYKQINMQQEQIQPRGWNAKGKQGQRTYERKYAILQRGVLIEPILWLAFKQETDAKEAFKQHICLCRNEDLLYPTDEIITTTLTDFNTNEELYSGFELIFDESEASFLVGYNRYKTSAPMYGSLRVVGTPVQTNY